MRMKRVIATALGLAVVGALAVGAAAQDDGGWLHGAIPVGELKYPPGFAHFDYVNPDAPKGGVVRLGSLGGYDTFNILPPQGEAADGLGLLYDSLMTGNLDESLAQYGLLAEGFRFADDYSWATYKLREDAYWHDGTPITIADVIWSFNTMKEVNPNMAAYYEHVVSAEQTGEWEVTFTFDAPGNRELPSIVGQLTVLPQHYWEGTDANGNPRDISAPTLEPPLGSGPYRIASFDPGRSLVYERVPDYWAANLNVNVGSNNFDEIRYEYFLDETVMFEAFKADQLDFRQENIARRWTNEYNFPAITDGRVIAEHVFTDVDFGQILGYIFNTRRAPFDNIDVRHALTLTYPYEEVWRDLFYELYTRYDAFFDRYELEAEGVPTGRELEILESMRDIVPPEVFTTDYTPPVNGTEDETRANLQLAIDLLAGAGFELRGSTMVNAATGQPLVIEFLNAQPSFEANALRWKEALASIGIDLQIRTVDSAQYIERVNPRDFDIIYQGWSQSLSPGNELLGMFHSSSRDVPGSRNFAGIADPAVDQLIEMIINAPDREEQVAATKALDRVLSWGWYLSPGWYLDGGLIAYWERYSQPEELPRFTFGFPGIWWWDEAKAAAIGPQR
ncbi:MAG: extracellular solute-binding protein [Bauldia sp.]